MNDYKITYNAINKIANEVEAQSSEIETLRASSLPIIENPHSTLGAGWVDLTENEYFEIQAKGGFVLDERSYIISVVVANTGLSYDVNKWEDIAEELPQGEDLSSLTLYINAAGYDDSATLYEACYCWLALAFDMGGAMYPRLLMQNI